MRTAEQIMSRIVALFAAAYDYGVEIRQIEPYPYGQKCTLYDVKDAAEFVVTVQRRSDGAAIEATVSRPAPQDDLHITVTPERPDAETPGELCDNVACVMPLSHSGPCMPRPRPVGTAVYSGPVSPRRRFEDAPAAAQVGRPVPDYDTPVTGPSTNPPWRPGDPCGTCGSRDTTLDDDGVATCGNCRRTDFDEEPPF